MCVCPFLLLQLDPYHCSLNPLNFLFGKNTEMSLKNPFPLLQLDQVVALFLYDFLFGKNAEISLKNIL